MKYASSSNTGKIGDSFRNVLWWCVYFILGIWVQLHFQGIDALLPGLLISLQEKRWQQTLWIALLCSLIQEGTGTLAFGASILWYGGLVVLFMGGRCFFVANSLFFVMIVSGILGMFNVLTLFVLTNLQKLDFPFDRALEQGLTQALIIPPLWGLAVLTRNKVFRHAESGI